MEIDLVEVGDRILNSVLKNGCTYADIRLEKNQKNSIIVEDGSVENTTILEDSGIGVRILKNNKWAYMSTSNLEKIDKINNIIPTILQQSDEYNVQLVDYPSFNESITLKPKQIPDLSKIKEIALDCYEIIKQKQNIINSNIHNQFNQISKLFMNTEGTRISQNYYDIFSEIMVTARENGMTQSVNITEGGRGGVEMLLDNEKIFTSTENISEKASELTNAKSIKEEKATIIMNPDFVALLTHEILGHPSEGDRVMGKEMAWAGGAWWAGKIGHKIGSEELSVFDDPTINGTFGSYKYDDEGVKSSRTQIIENGILKNHFQSRETAHDFATMPTGNMRATSYKFMPLIRMACTCIDNGEWNTDEMIKELKHGYLICNMKVPSIDMKRYNWSISSQYAYRIDNGEIGELVRDAIVVGNSPDFFSSIDACGNDFEIRPILNCGKGDPMQVMMMGNGGPSIRAKATIRGT